MACRTVVVRWDRNPSRIQQELPTSFDLIVDPALIPEYPLGLPLLVIFMVVVYGLIRRSRKA